MELSFSNISKRLRKENGISQVQLAKELNISNGCIAMLETNKSEPTANTLVKYADFFGCSTDYLLGRDSDSALLDTAIPKNANKKIPQGAPMGLKNDEQELLRCYAVLDEDLKYRAMGYMRKLASISDDESSAKKWK